MSVGFLGLNWGFTPQDLLSNADVLLVSLSGFILLGLAVSFAPRLIALIRFAILGDDDEDDGED